jgi:hypothetical protein
MAALCLEAHVHLRTVGDPPVVADTWDPQACTPAGRGAGAPPVVVTSLTVVGLECETWEEFITELYSSTGALGADAPSERAHALSPMALGRSVIRSRVRWMHEQRACRSHAQRRPLHLGCYVNAPFRHLSPSVSAQRGVAVRASWLPLALC